MWCSGYLVAEAGFPLGDRTRAVGAEVLNARDTSALQQVAAIRGFAWAGECERSNEPTAIVVLDVQGQPVGWATVAPLQHDLFTLFDAIEPMQQKEREQAFIDLEREERELITEFAATAQDVERAWLESDPELSGDEDLATLIRGDKTVSEAGTPLTTLSGLIRQHRAIVARRIASMCLRYDTFSSPHARVIATSLTSTRERVFRDSLRLAVSIARRHASGRDWLAAVSAATDGLVRAIERFDPGRGFQFSTYAQWWIRHRTNRVRHNHFDVLRLPVHASESLVRYRRVESELWKWGEPRPSHDTVQARLDSTLIVRNTPEWRRPTRLASGRIAEHIVDPNVPCPTEGGTQEGWIEIAENQLFAWFTEVAGVDLRGKQRKTSDSHRIFRILYSRIRGYGGDRATLLELGDEYGVSRERIRQLQDIALNHLHVKVGSVSDFDPTNWSRRRR